MVEDMNDISIDPILEEIYLKVKYGENADLRLAKIYEQGETEK